MFKYGFSETRSGRQRWNLEHIKSLPPLSPEIARKQNPEGKISLGSDAKAMTKKGTKHQQASSRSLGTGWSSNTEFDRVSSSLASWDEDDFEKEISRRVEIMLQELDAALYEGAPLPNQHLQQECVEWAAKFPYLRVIGKRITVPRFENGYQNRSVASSKLGPKLRDSESAPTNKLQLVGLRLIPSMTNDSSEKKSSTADLMEETLAQDGIYEELLAADSSKVMEGCHDESLAPAAQASTSVDHLQDEIMEALLDNVWPEIDKELSERRPKKTVDAVGFSHQRPQAERRDPRMSNKNQSHLLPTSVMEKRVPSTASAAYDWQFSTDFSKTVTPPNRAAPAFIKSKMPSNGTVFWRTGKYTRLPPIDAATNATLPNVPALKIHQKRGTNFIPKTNNSVDGAEDSVELARDGNIPPVPKSFAVARRTPKSKQPVGANGLVDSPTSLAENLQSTSNGQRPKGDPKPHNKGVSSRTRTGRRQQHSSLIVEGFHQRALSKWL